MVENDLLLAQERGERPNGTVTLRSFDQGIVETLGAQVVDGRYYINIEGLDPPTGEPGIPVNFMYPEDYYATFKYPAFVITRDDISISFGRIHPFTQQYRAPARNALPVTVQFPEEARSGFDRMAMRDQARPYDITYTINIYNSLRGGLGSRRAANLMLDHVLRIFPDYGQVWVPDSTGVYRSYEAFNEGIANMDDLAGVSERLIQFSVTVRVEAEYDLSFETNSRTVTQHPDSNFTPVRITRK